MNKQNLSFNLTYRTIAQSFEFQIGYFADCKMFTMFKRKSKYTILFSLFSRMHKAKPTQHIPKSIKIVILKPNSRSS